MTRRFTRMMLLNGICLLLFVQIGFGYVLVTIPPSPPDPSETAKMARYILHKSDWVSIATTSTQTSIKGYPFVSLKSVSDGPIANSTGIPYLYMTDLDVSGKDLEVFLNIKDLQSYSVDNRCTILASLAESNYCRQKKFDPQDPRCAKLLITGRLLKVNPTSPEYEFGKNALYERHPSMKWWPVEHNFYVAKIDIEEIAVLDFFGGIKHVSKEDYFNAYKREELFFLSLL